MESSFLTKDQALSLWSGSTDSKTLDYQRTNPREYQIELPQRKLLEYNTWHHPTTSSKMCKKPHLNDKQQTNKKYKPNHQQTGLPVCCQDSLSLALLTASAVRITSALPIWGKTNRNSAQISPYMKLTQTIGPILGGNKSKGRKEFNLEAWEKETSNIIS